MHNDIDIAMLSPYYHAYISIFHYLHCFDAIMSM